MTGDIFTVGMILLIAVAAWILWSVSGDERGLEREILKAIASLERRGIEAYGVTIEDEYTRLTESEVAAGRLYTALQRLVDNGTLIAEMTAPLPERGGRGKRLYRLAK